MYGVFVVGLTDPIISVTVRSDGVISLVRVHDRIEEATEVYRFRRQTSPEDSIYILEISPEQAKINNWVNIYYPSWLETLFKEGS